MKRRGVTRRSMRSMMLKTLRKSIATRTAKAVPMVRGFLATHVTVSLIWCRTAASGRGSGPEWRETNATLWLAFAAAPAPPSAVA